MIDLRLITSAIAELEEDIALQLLNVFVEDNPSQEEVCDIVAACQEGMAIVGDRFEKGSYYVGDLIFSGELLTEILDILKPMMPVASHKSVGKILLGTVRGDLHDIGKKIFGSMAEQAGFEVYDLGIDQPPEAFLEKAKELKPDVIGMSGVLTLALESMRDTVEELSEAGIRNSVKIILGGNPVTKDACEYIGADAYTTNAADGVRIVQEWMKEKSIVS